MVDKIKPLVEWVDESGFYTKTVWDIEKQEWIGPGKLQLFPHQRRILAHCFTPNEKGVFPYTTIVYSAIKKSGKTQIGALIGCWAAECFPQNQEMYTMANDKDQAAERAFMDMAYHVDVKHGIVATVDRIIFPSGTTMQALAQHYASAAGSRHALTLWDELWAFSSEKSRRMWVEMVPPATVPFSLRVVTTYAGFENESDLLLALYNSCFKMENGKYINGEVVPELADIVDSKGEPVCRRNGSTFIYWDTEPRMPWQTPEYFEREAADPSMRPNDFLRLHRNRWVTSNESFIPAELWDRAARRLPTQMTMDISHPYRSNPISIGIDIGLKHDCSALVGVYYDSGRRKVGLAFHQIWTPPEGGMIDLEYTVEQELKRLYKEFRIINVLYDPRDFQRSAQTLQKAGLPMVEFTQTQGNMVYATKILYDLLKSDGLEAYKDDELRDHILKASVDTNNTGFRLVKGKNAKYKIDAAVALAMACFGAVKSGGTDTSAPIVIEMPFTVGEIGIPTVSQLFDMSLPEALRG